MIRPLVTVAIANHNGGAYLGRAIASALAQDLREIEVLVVDDASDDDSAAIVQRASCRDPRVRLERLPCRRGAGGARNRALQLARGDWFAVLDHDDAMHPSRLARLVSRAVDDGADIIADDQLIFSDDGAARPSRLLTGRRLKAPTWLTAEAFLQETRLFHGGSNLGYLKPVIRLEALRGAGVRYDPALTIGEDHDLMLRLLTAGLRARIDPFLGYFYRRRPASLSHRMTPVATAQMLNACDRYRERLVDPPASLARAIGHWRSSILTAQALFEAVAALKAGDPRQAGAILSHRPQALPLFRLVLAGAARRILAPPVRRESETAAGASDVWFITRQRIRGRTNGSSTYLLDLAESVRRAGLTPRLLQPSPNILGRWPGLWLRREMDVFASIHSRGLVRLGPLVVTPNLNVHLSALRGVAAAALTRLGLPSAWLRARRAPNAWAAPITSDDRLFIARNVRRGAKALIADYAWQTEALPYALAPSARTAVVMHDLFHLRSQQFPRLFDDDVSDLTPDCELRMLARADAIIAIQKAEAAEVAARVDGRAVLVVPMSARPVPAAQPGNPRQVLFVASNAQPNVVSLVWMLEQVWPLVRQALPDLELRVAGSVSRAQPPRPAGVRYLGFVDRLDRLYAEAGLVVSPLIAGSGLKIKLIEALAHGKACVVTPVTLQGVEDEIGHAVAVADDPKSFADAMIRLLTNEDQRRRLGSAALEVVRTSFSADRLHAGFVSWLTQSVPAEATHAERGARSQAPPAAVVSGRSSRGSPPGWSAAPSR